MKAIWIDSDNDYRIYDYFDITPIKCDIHRKSNRM